MDPDADKLAFNAGRSSTHHLPEGALNDHFVAAMLHIFPQQGQNERSIVILHERMITPLRQKWDVALRIDVVIERERPLEDCGKYEQSIFINSVAPRQKKR